MWMQVFNWELSGRLREGRRQMESRGAAASEGWRGLRDLCGGQSHLISCLPLHLTHCCSHKRIAQLWSSAWIVTLPFRPSCSLKWSRFNSKSHKKRRNGRKPGCVIQFLNFNIPTKHLATRTPISIFKKKSIKHVLFPLSPQTAFTACFAFTSGNHNNLTIRSQVTQSGKHWGTSCCASKSEKKNKSL